MTQKGGKIWRGAAVFVGLVVAVAIYVGGRSIARHIETQQRQAAERFALERKQREAEQEKLFQARRQEALKNIQLPRIGNSPVAASAAQPHQRDGSPKMTVLLPGAPKVGAPVRRPPKIADTSSGNTIKVASLAQPTTVGASTDSLVPVAINGKDPAELATESPSLSSASVASPELEIGSGLTSPSQIATADAKNPGLVDWLRKRERAIANGDIASIQPDAELAGLLAQSKLSASRLYEIGNKLVFLATGSHGKKADNARILRPWCARMVQRALEEAQSLERGSPEAMKLVKITMAYEHRVMWPLADGKTIETAMDVYLRVYPFGHTMLVTARTSHAGALYLQGRSDEAMQEMDLASGSLASDASHEQVIEARWVRALLLCDQRKFEEAIPLLEATAKSSGYHHAVDALPLLVRAAAQVGDFQKAEWAYNEYVARNHASQNDLSNLRFYIRERQQRLAMRGR
jgi:hypothetical protein